MTKKVRHWTASESRPGASAVVFGDKEGVEEMRKSLISLFGATKGDDELRDFICTTFECLGLGETEPTLRRILDSAEVPLGQRNLALEVLVRAHALDEEQDMFRVDPEVAESLYAYRIKMIVRQIFFEPAAAAGLTGYLEMVQGRNEKAVYFHRMDEIRKSERLAAGCAYRDALMNSPDPVAVKLALESVVNEGGITGRSMLESLRCRIKDNKRRRQVQKALDSWKPGPRIRSESHGLMAWLGPCHDTGEAEARFFWRREEGGWDAAEFLFSLSDGLVDHAYFADGRAAAEILPTAIFPDEPQFTEVPCSVAAQLVMDSRKKRMEKGQPIIQEAEAAIARLEMVMEPVSQMPLALAEPLDEEGFRWFAGLETYQGWSESWVQDLGRADIASRLGYMAVWHRFRGEKRAAEIAQILALKPGVAAPWI